MSAVVPFQYGEHAVRTVVLDGEPHFAAVDLCTVLEIRNSRDAVASLDADEKGVATTDTPGGAQQLTVVTEPGMYSLVLRSRKPEAKAFKRWITHEVLPALRKTGSYSVPAAPALPQSYSEALRELAASVEAKEAAEARAAQLEPAAAAWDTLASARGDYSVADAAKVLSRDEQIEIGRDRLFALMEQMRWVFRTGTRGRWHAYQSQITTGRLVMRAGASFQNARTGEMEVADPTIRITAKGLQALHAHLAHLAKQKELVPA